MLVSVDRRRMISVFPKCTVARFALVLFLPGAAGNQLHTFSDDVWAAVFNQEMNVIGCNRVIEHRKTKAFLRLKNPVQVSAAVTGEFQ